MPDEAGLFVLGDPFLRSFVSTFNFASGKIELGVNIFAPEGTSITKELSVFKIASDVFKEELGITVSGFYIAGICMIAILLIAIIVGKCLYDDMHKSINEDAAGYGPVTQNDAIEGDQTVSGCD